MQCAESYVMLHTGGPFPSVILQAQLLRLQTVTTAVPRSRDDRLLRVSKRQNTFRADVLHRMCVYIA